VLVALNNTIARAKFHHVKYIVDQGLVALLLPLCHSTSVRVRLQALWIVGNTGTSEGDNGFKNVILSVDLVETILEVMYVLSGRVFCNLPLVWSGRFVAVRSYTSHTATTNVAVTWCHR
jgi:hypothetical protein